MIVKARVTREKVLKRSERWVDVQVFHVQLNVNEWIRFKREIKIGEEIEV